MVDSVLIIGGGPVGVELAGEIVVDFPTKKVKLQRRECGVEVYSKHL
jgi:NADH dehydrogenase FAD-containing subunit